MHTAEAPSAREQKGLTHTHTHGRPSSARAYACIARTHGTCTIARRSGHLAVGGVPAGVSAYAAHRCGRRSQRSAPRYHTPFKAIADAQSQTPRPMASEWKNGCVGSRLDKRASRRPTFLRLHQTQWARRAPVHIGVGPGGSLLRPFQRNEPSALQSFPGPSRRPVSPHSGTPRWPWTPYLLFRGGPR